MSTTDFGQAAGDGGSGGLGDKLRDVADKAREALPGETPSFVQDAAQTAQAKVDETRDAAVQGLGDFAEAIRKAGEELGGRDQSWGAQLARQAADGLSSLSQSLADKSPADMLQATRDFGRSNPMAFFAVSVAAGLALGRVAGAAATLAAQPAETPASGEGLQAADVGGGGGQAGVGLAGESDLPITDAGDIAEVQAPTDVSLDEPGGPERPWEG